LLTWRYNSGFSVHNGVRLARDDKAGRKALAQYIIRNPFAVSTISYNPASGMVIYKSKPTPRRSSRVKNFPNSWPQDSLRPNAGFYAGTDGISEEMYISQN
jgi:hypothetical protein